MSISDSMIQRSWTEHFVIMRILPADYPQTACKKTLINLVNIHFSHLLDGNVPKDELLRHMAEVVGIRMLQVGEYSLQDRKAALGLSDPNIINKKKKKKAEIKKRAENNSYNIVFADSYNKIVNALPSASMFSDGWLRSNDFLNSLEWKRARYAAILKSKGACLCCGSSYKRHGAHLCVDHIKPRKTHPKLALSIGNLQVLCEKCNAGKGNITEDNWL